MYNGTKVLDVHGHVSPGVLGNQYVATLLSSHSVNRRSPLLGGRGAAASDESYREASAAHVKMMDERSIDVQVIGPRPVMMMAQHLSVRAFRLWTEHVNTMIAQQVKFYPERFLGACQLPQDPSAPDSTHMLETLETTVTEMGFVAAYVSPDPGGRQNSPGLDDPYWFALYEKCIELDVPIVIHGTNSLDPRHESVPDSYQLASTIEQLLAQAILSTCDVFDRYPTLRVMICHCGGALTRFMPSDARHRSQKDLSANLFYDTCAHDIHFLTAAIRQRGVAQMCFGSETPGAGDAPRKAGDGPGITADDLIPVLDSFDWLTAEEKARIVNANPLRVFPGFARL